MKRIKQIAALIAWAPLIIVAIPFLIVFGIPAAIFFQTKAAISLRTFRRRENGHVFLICTSKRDWHDFLKNNVIPVLPDNFRVVWHKSVRDGEYSGLIGHLAQSHIFAMSKPYLVAVTQRALLPKTLNLILQDLKRHPKRSEGTQAACLQIIMNELPELRTKP